jgi:hypothetical protein
MWDGHLSIRLILGGYNMGRFAVSNPEIDGPENDILLSKIHL